VRRLARRLAKCGATKEALASVGSRYRVERLGYDTAARTAMEWGAQILWRRQSRGGRFNAQRQSDAEAECGARAGVDARTWAPLEAL
jgi:hypothetical protein